MEAGLVIRIQLEPQWVGHSRSHGKTDPITPTHTHTHTHTHTCRPTHSLTHSLISSFSFNIKISLQEIEYKCTHLLQAELTCLALLSSSSLSALQQWLWVAPVHLFLPVHLSSQQGSFGFRWHLHLFLVNFMFRCVLRQLIPLPNICVGRAANLELGTCSYPHWHTQGYQCTGWF